MYQRKVPHLSRRHDAIATGFVLPSICATDIFLVFSRGVLGISIGIESSRRFAPTSVRVDSTAKGELCEAGAQ